MSRQVATRQGSSLDGDASSPGSFHNVSLVSGRQEFRHGNSARTPLSSDVGQVILLHGQRFPLCLQLLQEERGLDFEFGSGAMVENPSLADVPCTSTIIILSRQFQFRDNNI